MKDNGLNIHDKIAYLEAQNRYLANRNAKLTAAVEYVRGAVSNKQLANYLDGVLDTSQDTQPIIPIGLRRAG